jgi:hypothetical protein
VQWASRKGGIWNWLRFVSTGGLWCRLCWTFGFCYLLVISLERHRRGDLDVRLRGSVGSSKRSALLNMIWLKRGRFAALSTISCCLHIHVGSLSELLVGAFRMSGHSTDSSLNILCTLQCVTTAALPPCLWRFALNCLYSTSFPTSSKPVWRG